MIEQISIYNSNSNALSGSTISAINHSQPTTENIGVGMYLSFMGSCNISAPILAIGSTLGSNSMSLSLVPFHTMYLDDPWTLLSPRTLDESPRPTNTEMSLSLGEVAYQAILDLVVDPSPSSLRMKEEDLSALLSWVVTSSHSHDLLDDVLPSHEAILEAMNHPECLWEELHHSSYFLLELEQIKHDDFRMTLSENVRYPMLPLGTHGVYVEGNMENI